MLYSLKTLEHISNTVIPKIDILTEKKEISHIHVFFFSVARLKKYKVELLWPAVLQKGLSPTLKTNNVG